MDAYSSDEDYLAAFEKKIMPAAKKFAPEFILISAGFDAHRNDPLSQIQLTTGAFGKMTDYVMELATEHAQGRVVSLLEGGYNLQALSESVLVHLEHMK
jgi:acetoin utilization deacetylase AcuC-like enzyme